MPLQNICKKYKGGNIILYPTYGYGWAKFYAGVKSDPGYLEIEQIGCFAIQIEEFIEEQDKIFGVLAKVEKAHDVFGGTWVTAIIMLGPQETNFTDRICGKYHLEFYREKPPSPKYSKPENAFFSGNGILAENEEFVEKRFENWDKQPDKNW